MAGDNLSGKEEMKYGIRLSFNRFTSTCIPIDAVFQFLSFLFGLFYLSFFFDLLFIFFSVSFFFLPNQLSSSLLLCLSVYFLCLFQHTIIQFLSFFFFLDLVFLSCLFFFLSSLITSQCFPSVLFCFFSDRSLPFVSL